MQCHPLFHLTGSGLLSVVGVHCRRWLLSLNVCARCPVQDSIRDLFDEHGKVTLTRDAHISYLLKALERALPASYTSLDASQCWMSYWILHALDLLGALPKSYIPGFLALLKRCQHEGAEAPSPFIRTLAAAVLPPSVENVTCALFI